MENLNEKRDKILCMNMVERIDYKPQQHIANNNVLVSQLQRSVSIAKEAKVKKGMVVCVFIDDDELCWKKGKRSVYGVVTSIKCSKY